MRIGRAHLHKRRLRGRHVYDSSIGPGDLRTAALVTARIAGCSAVVGGRKHRLSAWRRDEDHFLTDWPSVVDWAECWRRLARADRDQQRLSKGNTTWDGRWSHNRCATTGYQHADSGGTREIVVRLWARLDDRLGQTGDQPGGCDESVLDSPPFGSHRVPPRTLLVSLGVSRSSHATESVGARWHTVDGQALGGRILVRYSHSARCGRTVFRPGHQGHCDQHSRGRRLRNERRQSHGVSRGSWTD